jgi:hypothetical protein
MPRRDAISGEVRAGAEALAFGGAGRVGSRRALLAADHRGRVWEPSQGSHINELE